MIWSWGWWRRNLCLQFLEKQQQRERETSSNPQLKETSRKLLLWGSKCQSRIVQCMWQRAGTIHPTHIVSHNSVQSADVNILLGVSLNGLSLEQKLEVNYLIQYIDRVRLLHHPYFWLWIMFRHWKFEKWISTFSMVVLIFFILLHVPLQGPVYF